MPAAPAEILSHWRHGFDDLQYSPTDFYRSVEEGIGRRRIPGASISRVEWHEGGLLSAKRTYLRVKRAPYIFDICAAPFGTMFFFSSWLGEMEGCLTGFLRMIPILGAYTRPRTYYQIDTALALRDAVHTAVLEAIDVITQAKGLRALSELERKPMMGGLPRR